MWSHHFHAIKYKTTSKDSNTDKKFMHKKSGRFQAHSISIYILFKKNGLTHSLKKYKYFTDLYSRFNTSVISLCQNKCTLIFLICGFWLQQSGLSESEIPWRGRFRISTTSSILSVYCTRKYFVNKMDETYDFYLQTIQNGG